jgi:hypothetical protein
MGSALDLISAAPVLITEVDPGKEGGAGYFKFKFTVNFKDLFQF